MEVISNKKIEVDTKYQDTLKLHEETLAIKAKNDTDKEMINSQFERIEQDNAALEERKIALDEEKQLLAIKDKDVSKKLATLTELRKKA
jgi:hypothetical protein